MNRLKFSYKLQILLGFIPFVGAFIVLALGGYNIKKIAIDEDESDRWFTRTQVFLFFFGLAFMFSGIVISAICFPIRMLILPTWTEISILIYDIAFLYVIMVLAALCTVAAERIYIMKILKETQLDE